MLNTYHKLGVHFLLLISLVYQVISLRILDTFRTFKYSNIRASTYFCHEAVSPLNQHNYLFIYLFIYFQLAIR